MSEVELLTAIHRCKRKSSETAEAYGNIFDAAVADQVHHSTISADAEDQQWEIILINNMYLLPDTISSLTFQLTTAAEVRTPTIVYKMVRENFAEIDALSSVLNSSNNEHNIEMVKAEVGSLIN